MTPEQKARQQIDRQLEQIGWIVLDYRHTNISAGHPAKQNATSLGFKIKDWE